MDEEEKGKNQDMTEEEDQGQQEKMENEKKGGLIDWEGRYMDIYKLYKCKVYRNEED